MIYVDNTSNQLNLTYDTRKDVYAFDSIKSVSFSWDANADYYVIINFIANDKNNSLRIYLKDVEPGLGWTNDFSGATVAVDTIAVWMDEVISAVVDIANPKGEQVSSKSVSVVLSSNQFRQKVTPNIIVESGHNDSLGVSCYSISFASNGTAAARISFDGGLIFYPIASGTTINMDAGGLGWYYDANMFYWDTTTNAGSSLIITYNN